MISSQARIAAIITGSLLAAIVLASTVGLWLVVQPTPERLAASVAGPVRAVLANAAGGTPLEGIGRIVDADVLGAEVPAFTSALRRRLMGVPGAQNVVVRLDADGAGQVAVLGVGPGTPDGAVMVVDVPEALRTPPEVIRAALAWLAIIFLAVVAISLILARGVTRPFAILETAAGQVGPDGSLPDIPLAGNMETRRVITAINQLSSRLTGAIESRMRLVAAAGHDMRTPLTRMRLRAEFMNEDDALAWRKDIDELERIAESAMELVRVETTTVAQERIDLRALVTEVTDDLAAQGHAVDLAATCAATCLGHGHALRRALQNLMINGALHGGGCTVGMSCLETNVNITVSDDGPGIPEALLDRVVEPFFQADPARGQGAAGAGLGLAIAATIIARAGGTLTLANRPEGGLRQTIVLPQADRPVRSDLPKSKRTWLPTKA